jgi:hypothetical protein
MAGHALPGNVENPFFHMFLLRFGLIMAGITINRSFGAAMAI